MVIKSGASAAFTWSSIILKRALRRSPLCINGSFGRILQSQRSPFTGFYRTFSSVPPNYDPIDQLFKDLDIEMQREREEESRVRAALGITEEEEEDWMGVNPLIEKLEKKNLKLTNTDDLHEEPTDSDSEDDEDEMFLGESEEEKIEKFERNFELHTQLLRNFTYSESFNEAYEWMTCIDEFEETHFKLRMEYRVIGELMNRLKVAEGKEKFLLQLKLNRAMRLVQWRESFDPNNPSNYGLIQHDQPNPSAVISEDGDVKDENQITKKIEDEENQITKKIEDEENQITKKTEDDEDEEFDDMKERDDILLEKLNAIDKKLEEKLANLDHTFGKKGKLLEEEIRDLAEERNDLTEKRRTPLYRKGFDVRLIDVNRTCKVTKGGQVIKYTAMLACGNYHGVIGFAKAKAPAVPIALQKAYEKCFQNLHYVERHEEHTIAHAVQTTYKKTKVYLWPARTATGMKAGKTVETILNLAGFKNVKSKVIGSRNPHNTVKAVFKALNAIETPKDVQEKFGRTVVESYLL